MGTLLSWLWNHLDDNGCVILGLLLKRTQCPCSCNLGAQLLTKKSKFISVELRDIIIECFYLKCVDFIGSTEVKQETVFKNTPFIKIFSS
jgi:hypothetical protein